MRMLTLICVFAAVLGLDSAAAADVLHPFNGRDLSGWTAVPAAAPDGSPIWTVDGGLIRCAGRPKGYLRTNTAYANFRLRVQWRWAGKPGNSGVFVRGHGPDAVWPHCYEAQLAHGNAGELRANGGAKLHPDSDPKDRVQKRLEASSEKPAGEWNQYEIVCQGPTIDLYVNGVHQNHLENAATASGWIALQSEGGVIEFRDLTLEPL
jgi:hypothetical protein